MPGPVTRPALRLAIIADDLTGAQDTAAPFAARSAQVGIALTPGAVTGALAEGPEIIAISTDSRDLAPADAAARVAAAVAALPPGTRLFKKVDSRLKGNIPAEIAAIAFRRALVAPAIPEFGRIVQGGRLQGFGIAAPIEVAAALGGIAGRAEIPDLLTQADIETALAASTADLLVGARGLGEALAAMMYPGEPPRMIAALPGPRMLAGIGSHDPITLAQVQAAQESGAARVVPAPNGEPAGSLDGDRVVLLARPDPRPGSAPLPADTVARRLAAAVRLAMRADTLVLSGGATAAVILAEMGITHLRLSGECLPGLTVTRHGPTAIILKSGGFGTPATLLDLSRLIASHGTTP